MTIRANKIKQVVRALTAYTEEQFINPTDDKLAFVSLMYSVILMRAEDLTSKRHKAKQQAKEYFNSSAYTNDCYALCIDKDLLNNIIFSPHKFLASIGEYSDEGEFNNDIF